MLGGSGKLKSSRRSQKAGMSNRSESSTAGSGASEASRRTQAGAGSSAQAPVVPNILTPGESALARVDMIPSKTVTFFPNEKRQQTYVVLSNNSDRKVMFKMKSTRPGVYKMKPVFGVVNPGEKYSIRVTYMGIKVGHRIPLNDRITVVLAAVTSKAGEAEKEATESEMKKRKLYILYKGVNDQVDPEAGGDAEKKPAVDKKQEAKLAADQKAYMEGYDEGYKAAIIESRDPKASDNPAEALERLQKSKGIGKEPKFQEGFTEGYKKAMALLKTTEKKEVKEEKKEIKEEKKEVKEEKSEPKETKPSPKGPLKESAKDTAKELEKPKEERGKVRSGRKSKSKSKPSKKSSKGKEKKVVKTPKKKSKVVGKEPAKEPAKPPPKAPPEQVKTPKKVKSPPKEVVKEPAKKPVEEPPKESPKPPPKETAKPREPKKEPQMVKEEVKKEVKVKREEAKEVKKEFEKVEKEKKLSDGTNVTAFTPGGTDPSLGDPLKRQDIVHIGPTGKKQIVIIMYRDVALPEKLLSRSGDEDEDDDDVKSDLPQPPQPN